MAMTRLNTMLSRGRPLAIVLVLLAALALIALLGWQSWQIQRSNQATADSVLREYGILAADELGRRASAELGYRGYYQLMLKIAGLEEPGDMRESLVADDALANAATLVVMFFVVSDGEVATDSSGLSPEVSTLLQNIVATPGSEEGPYSSARTESGSEQIIYAKRSTAAGTLSVAGFVVSNIGIGEHLGRTISAGPLLPASLASGRVNNEMLFVRVSDPGGAVVFEQNPSFDSRLTVNKTLGDDYQGILDGFVIEVSLDPASAEFLIIGGLPESQLPVLLYLMAFVAALMLTAIWLFRREQSVMNLRTDFVSQVSHELRTPLTQIRMFAETLLLGRARTDEERRRSLEIIDRESQRLSHLVDNILLFSNGSDPAPLDRRRQQLAPVVVEVCDLVRATAESVTIDVSVDESAIAVIDSDALRQVLLNLLDNAIKFGPAGQTVSVWLERSDNEARISVEDQGPGIPEGERRRVWSPFYRLRREKTSAISGTGIGLSVVQELVDAMGGRCWVSAGYGGARVCVAFPEVTSDE